MKIIYNFLLLYLIVIAIILIYLILVYREKNGWEAKTFLQKIKIYSNFLKNNNKYRLHDAYINENKINIPVLYINLENSVERKNFMENQLKNYGVKKYKRVEAIKGNLINNINQDSIQGINFVNDFELNKSELG